jgi:hypothetical protein
MIRQSIVAVLLGIVAAQAVAQSPAGNQAPGSEGRRAPLAMPDDLAPAVDVGGSDRGVPAESATADRPSATAGPAAIAPGSAQAAPDSTPRAPDRAATAPAAGRRSQAMDTLDLGTTSITGNQELPKVLYIVPWKRSDLGDLAGRPVNTLLDEVLTPIDPEVFERQLKYFDSLYGTTVKE